MNKELLSTPPSRKPAQHHGMADRKPVRYQPLGSLDGCNRRLFAEELPLKTAPEPKTILSLRF